MMDEWTCRKRQKMNNGWLECMNGQEGRKKMMDGYKEGMNA